MAPLKAVFNHIVLLPKLPECEDVDIGAIEQSILTRLIYACDAVGGPQAKNVRNHGLLFEILFMSALKTKQFCLEKALMLQNFYGL